jgi:RNA polymerase sigma-70 factor, ECF subfamily
MPDRQDADEVLLLKAAQQGDTLAYGKLYESYAARVFRFLYAHLDERMDAEDLTEEVFLRVWQALPNYQLRGLPFSGFLFRAARNALYDHYRHTHGRRAPERLDEEQLPASTADPAEVLAATHENAELRHLLDQLGDEQRTVLALRFLAGLSIAETSQAMGKSRGAVRVQQHRALTALRKLI